MEHFERPYTKPEITTDVETTQTLMGYIIENDIDDSTPESIAAAVEDCFGGSHTLTPEAVESVVAAYQKRVAEQEADADSYADALDTDTLDDAA